MMWQASQRPKACFTSCASRRIPGRPWTQRAGGRRPLPGWAGRQRGPRQRRMLPRRLKKPTNGRRAAVCPASWASSAATRS